MFSKSTKTISLIIVSIVAASLLASCATATPAETESAVPSSSVVESSVSETTTDTSEETEYTGFSVETEPHENPFGDFIFDDDYNPVGYKISRGGVSRSAYYYGFDCPYIISALKTELYECTGIVDNNITLSDVSYFQNNPLIIEIYGLDSDFYSLMTKDSNVSIEALMAVMSELELRFGIDEIPASYLMERFPRFYYDEFEAETGLAFSLTTEVEISDISTLSSLTEISDDNYLDVVLWKSCISYNIYRVNCMFGHPYGDDYSGFIIQVRDAETGKNVLVPTPEQAALMQEDINSMAGLEDVDIFIPQTPDDFYNVYGYYPDELLEVRDDSVNAPANAQEYIDYLQNVGV